MIFTTINGDYKNEGLDPALVKALDYLKDKDFSQVPTGREEIENDNIFANVIETSTGKLADKKGESHRAYVDVQFLVEGAEKIGFSRLDDSYLISYDSENDFISYDDVKNENYLILKPGDIAIFFPEDIHKPAIAVEEPAPIKKVVVKVRTDLLR